MSRTRRRPPSRTSFLEPKTDLRFLFFLADRLKKFVWEIEEMPPRERKYWGLLVEVEDYERRLGEAQAEATRR